MKNNNNSSSLRSKNMLWIISCILIGIALGIPLGSGDLITVGANHWTRDTDDGFLYPTNSSDDVSLNNNSLLWANLNSYAGDNITWDAVDMEFDVSADGTSKWNDESGVTLFPKTNGINMQVNATVNGSNGEFSYLDVGNDANISGDANVTGNIILPLESKLFFGHNNDAYIYREDDGDFWIMGNSGPGNPGDDTLDVNSWNSVTFDTIEQFSVLANSAAYLKAEGGTVAVELGSSGIYFAADNNDAFTFNNEGNNVDLRYESLTDNNLLYIDASKDNIGIGTNTPSDKLQVIDNVNVTGNVNITEDVNISGSLIVGEDNDSRIYEDDGDLYINNSQGDKDIIFQVNDNGIFKDFVTIDSSRPTFELNAGDFEGSVAAPIFYAHGTTIADSVAIILRFDVVQAGGGTAFVTYGTPSTTGITGGTILGHYLQANGAKGDSGTYRKTGYEADINGVTAVNDNIGGLYLDTGFDADLKGLSIYPNADGGADISRIGFEVSRSAYAVSNLLGGSIDDLTSYGLYVKGFGSADTITGVSGVYDNKAIYSDGGDVTFENCEFNQSGGDALINNVYAEMWFHNDVSPNVTDIPFEDIWYNISAFEQADNAQVLNGFTYSNNNLTCLIEGKYKVTHSITHSGGGANNKYHFAVGINGVPQFNTETHERMGNVNDIASCSSSGFLDLSVDDLISSQVMNEDGGNDVTVYSANLNLVRIGD